MNIPHNIELKMKNFAQTVRSGKTNSRSIKIYSDFIIENIYGVINHTFPNFAFYADKGLKDKLIKYFLENSKSFDPAFHQIATGILKCSQNIDMCENLRKLIEFEWLVFDTQIANCIVELNEKASEDIGYEDIVDIEFNPTLTIITLPFDINELKKDIELNFNSGFFYSVYRNIDHNVTFHKLSQLEFVLLSNLINIGISTFSLDDFKVIDSGNKKYLLLKIYQWHNSNMLKLKY